MLNSAPFVFLPCMPIVTHSLFVASMSPNVVTSFKISLTIPLSLNPLMSCSTSNLLYYFIPEPTHQSFCRLIHFLCNSWYFGDITILLCNCLNLLHVTMKRPFLILSLSLAINLYNIVCTSYCILNSLHTDVGSISLHLAFERNICC